MDYGADGLDEILNDGPPHIVSLHDGVIKSFDIAPEDVGMTRSTMDDLRGGDADLNAIALRAMLR